MHRHSWLQTLLIVVLVAGTGFLAAFFIDNVRTNPISSRARAMGDAITDTIDSLANPNNFNQGDTANTASFELPALVQKLQTISKPWGSVTGLTMFRGSPTRTYYGTGPLPAEPQVIWRYPNATTPSGNKPMCMYSEAEGVTKEWCGSGWTGQPVVWERPDGITEVIFGAYDGAVHFLNAKTGEETRPAFQTGDLIKGSVTLDPDGYPLLYFGSRDNKLRILSLDNKNADGTFATPTELWVLNANEVKGMWNNDWDGNPVMINDVLFEGGENSWFFAMKVNRSYKDVLDVHGKATGEKKVAIDPHIIFKMPVWNGELLSNIGDKMVSVEDSVTFFGNRVYFANSGGRVLGLDISKVEEGIAPIVFDYWVGDDTDATIVVDDDGNLYIASELERNNAREAELGQLMKLDPSKQKIVTQTVAADGTITTQTEGDPYVWGVSVPKGKADKGGIWATPALSGDYLYVTTHPGSLLTVNKNTGVVTDETYVGEHAWSSPIVIDNADGAGTKKLLVGICTNGGLEQFSLADPAKPVLTNKMPLASGACIESTPAVWKGHIYVGTRDGYFYNFGEK